MLEVDQVAAEARSAETTRARPASRCGGLCRVRGQPDARSRVQRRMRLTFTVKFDQELDGRWIAEVVERPGVLAYCATPERAAAEALRVLATTLELAPRPRAARSVSLTR